MKTTTCKLQFGATLLAIFLLVNLSFTKQETKGKYLTLSRPMVGLTGSKLVIMTAEGVIEEIPTEKSNADNFTINEKTYIQTLDKIAAKGYELVSDNGMHQLFVKK